jgi:NADH-quinone oxidoreductase subunit C
MMLPPGIAGYPEAMALDAAFPQAITGGKYDRGEYTIEVAPEQVVDACRFLKNERQFVRLSTITGVDWFPAEPRFEVVYHLHSLAKNARLRVKCRLTGDRPEIESVTTVWRSAGWYERETFDLFGIQFHQHPDLRRIMLPDDWDGHPLRKDYPVTGSRV